MEPTTKTMRVSNVREIQVTGSEPVEVELTLTEDGAMMPGGESVRRIVPISEQRLVGTKFSVVSTFTEITA